MTIALLTGSPSILQYLMPDSGKKHVLQLMHTDAECPNYHL